MQLLKFPVVVLLDAFVTLSNWSHCSFLQRDFMFDYNLPFFGSGVYHWLLFANFFPLSGSYQHPFLLLLWACSWIRFGWMVVGDGFPPCWRWTLNVMRVLIGKFSFFFLGFIMMWVSTLHSWLSLILCFFYTLSLSSCPCFLCPQS